MKPIVLWGVTLALLALVAGFSSSRAAPSTTAESPKVELQVEAKNPWTSLELNAFTSSGCSLQKSAT